MNHLGEGIRDLGGAQTGQDNHRGEANGEHTPVNVMLVLYVPTNSLILVDHLNRTMRNLGNSATDPTRDYFSRKPYVRAYDKGDGRRDVSKGDVFWQDLVKAGTPQEYKYL